MLTDLDMYETDEESIYSTSNKENVQNENVPSVPVIGTLIDGDLGDFLDPDLSLACQTKKADPFGVRSRPATSKRNIENAQPPKQDCDQCRNAPEKLYHVNYDTILKLKESTRKLLCVLEEIQAKTRSKHLFPSDSQNLSKLLQPYHQSNELQSATDILTANAIKKLEVQAKNLDPIYVQEEEDDCSIYKRLTRRCNCLNQCEYNDFVIHFNEDTKCGTSIAGEIIKNMRILKKFLYMNGEYTKNALLFLNEGLSESSHTEKVEIIQGCAHADMCNVFDEHSIVVMYISWPCKNPYFGDTETQALAAGFLYKLAQLEEGRRYLNYSTRVCNDIKKILKKKASVLEFDTMESLNATINLLIPPITQNVNVTYYCKPIDEGMGKKTVQTLADYRQNMTLGEVIAHLELLYQMSNRDKGKEELLGYLPALIILFKRLLVEFDNSEMNIVITNILNNVVSKTPVKEKEPDTPKTLIIADVGTEPILMKHQSNQIPMKKNNRKNNKSKLALGNLGVSPIKFRNASRRKDLRSSIIIVPIEKKNN